jgi:protein-S-isoprenylcysteine O-methyltransferase Ste14
MPRAVIKNFTTPSFLGFTTNLIILIFGLYVVFRLTRDSLTKPKNKKLKLQNDNALKLAILLIWTSISAYVVFVASNHDYSVDARYMGIVLFAVFVCLAIYSTRLNLQPEIITLIGVIIGLSVVSGTYFAWHSYKSDMSALSSQNNRNQIVSEVLSGRPVDALVGDYWRVVPIKLDSGNQQNIIPLGSCTSARSSLISANWLTNLNKTSFAYLLSLSGGNLTNYPHCTINQVISYYGRPNSSQVIAGSLAHPKEILLFYPNGIVKKPASTVDTSPAISTILPVNISSLPLLSCDHPTSVNIVAHEDDDLLFMNPDIINEIKQGYCERTIYITAGDAGGGISYYLSRQEGAEAAYAEMTRAKDLWSQKTIQITPNEYVTFAYLESDAKITLVFMHLPDGGLQGQGFASTHFQTIDKLYSGSISNITTVDGQSVYTVSSLESALTNLMLYFGPSEIRTQSTYSGGMGPIKDHPDHNTVGKLVTVAARNYNLNQYANLTAIPVKYYEGYPIRDNPVNLSGVELNEKEAAFLAYSVYDGSTCASLNLCEEIPTYWGYLHRQYTLPY